MWVKEADLEEFSMEDSSKFHTLRAWGRQHSKYSSFFLCD